MREPLLKRAPARPEALAAHGVPRALATQGGAVRRCTMPGIVLFGRRWSLASDDLVFPGSFELFLRVLSWIASLTLYLMHRRKLDCPGGVLLSTYLVVLLVLLAVIICTVLAMVCVSMRGTICNPGPRKSMAKLLYVRLALFLPEMVWASLGAFWVAKGIQCDKTVVIGIITTVIVSWIVMAATMVTIFFVFDPLGGMTSPHPPGCPEHLDSNNSSQLLTGLKTAAKSVWETRVMFCCCCVVQDDNARVAFSSAADLFSTYFSDTDLVPSDIAAGFTLLHQQQDNINNSLEPQEVVTPFPGQSQEPDLDAEVENCHHFMPFAAAAYGWPLYIYRNPFTGLCRIGGDCCGSRETEYDAVEGDQHNCHFASILKTTGLQYRDFIHISFHDKVYELPFIVVLDHRKEAVVVAVRGTMSLQDVLTDLSAETENIELDAELQDCVAHKGIAQAARYIYRRLVNDGILSQAFSVAPEYRLVLVGHSLGAGAAALLAIMLRRAYPQVRAYAFSPPRGLLSKPLYEHSKDFIVSLILGMDVIPRLSVTNMEDLKRRILRVIANCNKPKYKILLHGCWYGLFGGNPDNSPTELDEANQRALTQPLLGEQSLLTRCSPGYSSSDSPLDSPTKYPPLYPPGRIIHLEEESGSGRFGCCSAARYRARWAHEAEFGKILIGPKMLTDHLPNIVNQALDRVVADRTACVSCPGQGGPPTAVA